MLGLESLTYDLLINLGLPFLAAVFLLEGMLIGKFIPTDFLLPAAVVMYATQTQHYFLLLAITATSSTLGQCWLYLKLQEHDEEEIVENKYFKIPSSQIEKASDKFNRYGPKAVLISNMIPGIRGLMTIPAGLQDMSPKKFIIYSAIGTILFQSLLIAIGAGIISFI